MMDWYSVALAGIVGAVVSIIATYVFSKQTESKSTYYVFVIVLFFILNYLAKHYLLIPFEIAKAKRNVMEIPEVQLLRKYDPTTFYNISRDLDVNLKRVRDTQNTISQKEAISQMRLHVDDMLKKRLPVASDEAVLTYISVKTLEMRELHNQNPELCRKALSPQRYGIYIEDFISKDLAKLDFASLANVIKTSAEHPQSIPSVNEISADLDIALSGFKRKYPSTPYMLAASDPDAFVEDTCNVIAEMYETIIATLPPHRSSKVIRHILSEKL